MKAVIAPIIFIVAGLFPGSFAAAAATPEDGPGVLKGEFISQDPNHTDARCPPPAAGRIAAIATDILVGLAGKLTESLIDGAAARTQPEATTLETVVPIDGFYAQTGAAIDGGCLVFRNGTAADGSNSSMLAIFQVVMSTDQSAFRFDVLKWTFSRFLRPETSQRAQKKGIRDFVMKIEFLAPGTEGVGTRKVFIETSMFAVTSAEIAGAYVKGQQLPWFAAPPRPDQRGTTPPKITLPLNVKITLVETTKPNQFALWLQKVAQEKKADISSAVQDAVKKALDPNYAATEGAKAAEAAGTAYAAYKTAWDALAAVFADKPVLPPNPTSAQTAEFNAKLKVWTANVTVNQQLTEAKRVSAKVAFDSAGLPWPGDLPKLGG